MMLIVLVCASDRCGDDNNPTSSQKVFGRFRKILKAKKFLDLARHRLDTYSGSRIRRRLRGVWLTLDYMLSFLDDFLQTWYNVFEPLLCIIKHVLAEQCRFRFKSKNNLFFP